MAIAPQQARSGDRIVSETSFQSAGGMPTASIMHGRMVKYHPQIGEKTGLMRFGRGRGP
jgi:hypothetical protein